MLLTKPKDERQNSRCVMSMHLWKSVCSWAMWSWVWKQPCYPVQSFRPQNSSGHPTPLPYPISPKSNNGSSNINVFVRYLAQRELMATALLQLNDKPQNYRAWKQSVQTASIDLNLTPSEEMDLLLKWLARSQQIMLISHPQAWLAMAWDRGDQTYGLTEVI